MKILISLLFVCGIPLFLVAQNNYKEISLLELMQKNKSGTKSIILDVRTPGEYLDTSNGGKHIGIGRIKTAINISLQDLLQKPETIHQLDQYRNDEVFVICSHSYRSRRISNLLLQNGFTNVNNVKGGMTEWYRNYDALKPYMPAMYENNVAYHNMAPAELFHKLQIKETIEFICFNNAPRFYYDSLITPFFPFFPQLKNTQCFRTADSLALLEKISSSTGKYFVLFNKVGGGADEGAEWLAKKGVTNFGLLVGNLFGFYEYMVNFQPAATKNVFVNNSAIQFFTPLSLCRSMPSDLQWIDIRHDTDFNQVTEGTKLKYKTLKGAINFPSYKSADEFVSQFPDKSKFYLLFSTYGYESIELAGALLKKGYHIGWLMGGIERWEWYTNNINDFTCRDYFIQ
jgi:rhodanese-related sulfurtransferase